MGMVPMTHGLCVDMVCHMFAFRTWLERTFLALFLWYARSDVWHGAHDAWAMCGYGMTHICCTNMVGDDVLGPFPVGMLGHVWNGAHDA